MLVRCRWPGLSLSSFAAGLGGTHDRCARRCLLVRDSWEWGAAFVLDSLRLFLAYWLSSVALSPGVPRELLCRDPPPASLSVCSRLSLAAPAPFSPFSLRSTLRHASSLPRCDPLFPYFHLRPRSPFPTPQGWSSFIRFVRLLFPAQCSRSWGTHVCHA